MKLSIIVPIYQVEKYLERCVDSLLDQKDFSDYEIILVDDGSADESGRMCDEYALNNDLVTIIHKCNSGQASARNIGVNHAQGEYIQFVDSDDFIASDCLNGIVVSATKQNADIQCFDFKYVYDGYQIVDNDMHSEIDGVVSGREYLKINLKQKTMLMSPCMYMFRRDIVTGNDIRFIEGRYHEDEEWVPRLFYHAERVWQGNECVYGYCIRGNSTTTSCSNNRKAALDLVSNCESLAAFCKQVDDSELRELLEDHTVSIALSAYYKGRITDQHDRVYGIISDLYTQKRNKKKIVLFKQFPRGYIFVNRCIKRIKGLSSAVGKLCSFVRKCWDYAKQKIHKYARRQLVCGKQVKELTNHCFSIISSNCNGGVITSELREQFRTPTINLFMSPADYLKFAENLEYYLSLDVVEKTNSFKRFPVGTIGDVTLYFMHYHSFDEAREKWNERKKRVNYDNLFFMMAEKDGCTAEMVRQFDSLSYKNKVIFTANEYPNCASAVCVAPDAKNGEAPIMTDYVSLTHRIYDKYFDYVGWLNS